MSGSSAPRLFVHVEEPSMKQAAETLLPRIIGARAVTWKVIDHGSKQALLQNLPARMRGYARWGDPGLRVLVLVDRDDDECQRLKSCLERIAIGAGLYTKSKPSPADRFQVANRIVIEELEAWFLGDVPALAAAFPGVPTTLGQQARFRDPDAVQGGTWEALLRVLQKVGHFQGLKHLPKTEVARRIVPHMSLDGNRSRSFAAFVAGVDALLSQ